MLRFEGYVDKSESTKKVIRDVVRKGDRAFASGDVLYWDRLGYLYFVGMGQLIPCQNYHISIKDSFRSSRRYFPMEVHIFLNVNYMSNLHIKGRER